jgi:hypothetical protein
MARQPSGGQLAIAARRADPSTGFADAEGTIQAYTDQFHFEAAFVFYRNADGNYMASFYYGFNKQGVIFPHYYDDWGQYQNDLDVPGSEIIAIEHTHTGVINTPLSGIVSGPSFIDAGTANQYPNAFSIISQRVYGGGYHSYFFGPSVGKRYETDWY